MSVVATHNPLKITMFKKISSGERKVVRITESNTS